VPSIEFGKVEMFEHAGQLLEALHPMDQRWEIGPPGHWIFRGHWDSNWQLVPSLYRRESVEPFLPTDWNFEGYVATGPRSVAQMEARILNRALDEFDNAGLPIPDAMTVRRFLANAELEEVEDELIPFMALAQHYRVPTRLLDWTTQGKVAAYFAAAGLVQHSKKRDGTLEVVGLFREALSKLNANGQQICRLCKAPRASNANLHAQSGVFTVCNGQFVNTPLDYLLFDSPSDSMTRLRRLRLPQDQAHTLLLHLQYEGVSGASVFPGYDGAVRRMKEEKFYWKIPTDP
jgi:hypothetical protein